MFAIRRTFTVAAVARQPALRLAAPATRSFARGPLDKKEQAEEKAYFSKKDAKLMKALLEKMEQEGQTASEEAACAAQEDLEELFTAHKLDKDGAHKALFTELMDWKKHEY